MERIMREITPVKNDDLFVVLDHQHAKFDFPLHFHPEYELNFVINSKGKRIIGDSLKDYRSPDLVLIGPNIPHAWTGENNHDDVRVITIQFDKNVFGNCLLNKKHALPMKDLLDKASRGILFDNDTIITLKERITNLSKIQGFDAFISFLSILYDLSISRNQTLLTSPGYIYELNIRDSQRINKVINYIKENISKDFKIKEVANLVNMSESAFSHFFKKRTQLSFSDYVIDMRVSYAARLIMETDKSISEICFASGFNNISNFNRTFKSRYSCTPTEMRSRREYITRH